MTYDRVTMQGLLDYVEYSCSEVFFTSHEFEVIDPYVYEVSLCNFHENRKVHYDRTEKETTAKYSLKIVSPNEIGVFQEQNELNEWTTVYKIDSGSARRQLKLPALTEYYIQRFGASTIEFQRSPVRLLSFGYPYYELFEGPYKSHITRTTGWFLRVSHCNVKYTLNVIFSFENNKKKRSIKSRDPNMTSEAFGYICRALSVFYGRQMAMNTIIKALLPREAFLGLPLEKDQVAMLASMRLVPFKKIEC